MLFSKTSTCYAVIMFDVYEKFNESFGGEEWKKLKKN